MFQSHHTTGTEAAKGIPPHPPVGPKELAEAAKLNQEEATKQKLSISPDGTKQTYGQDQRVGFGGHIGSDNRQGLTGMAQDPREHGLGGMKYDKGYMQMVKEKAQETKEGLVQRAEEFKHKWLESHPEPQTRIPPSQGEETRIPVAEPIRVPPEEEPIRVPPAEPIRVPPEEEPAIGLKERTEAAKHGIAERTEAALETVEHAAEDFKSKLFEVTEGLKEKLGFVEHPPLHPPATDMPKSVPYEPKSVPYEPPKQEP